MPSVIPAKKRCICLLRSVRSRIGMLQKSRSETGFTATLWPLPLGGGFVVEACAVGIETAETEGLRQVAAADVGLVI